MIKSHNFYTSLVNNFFVSFGVVVGGSIFIGIAGILTNNPPLRNMINLASSIKIWAMAIALGGSFSSFEIIDKGLFSGEIKSIVKQVIYIMVALLGSNAGYGFIKLIQRCSDIWAD